MAQAVLISTGFDTDPDVVPLDVFGRALVLFLVRQIKLRNGRGKLPRKYWNVEYLAPMLGAVGFEKKVLAQMRFLASEHSAILTVEADHVVVHNYGKFNVDPTAAARQQRHRQRKREASVTSHPVTPDNGGHSDSPLSRRSDRKGSEPPKGGARPPALDDYTDFKDGHHRAAFEAILLERPNANPQITWETTAILAGRYGAAALEQIKLAFEWDRTRAPGYRWQDHAVCSHIKSWVEKECSKAPPSGSDPPADEWIPFGLFVPKGMTVEDAIAKAEADGEEPEKIARWRGEVERRNG